VGDGRYPSECVVVGHGKEKVVVEGMSLPDVEGGREMVAERENNEEAGWDEIQGRDMAVAEGPNGGDPYQG